MIVRHWRRFLPTLPLLFVMLLLASSGLAGAAETRQVVLTWQDDPTTTMTVTWRSQAEGRFTVGDHMLWVGIDDAFADFDNDRHRGYDALSDPDVLRLLDGKGEEYDTVLDALSQVIYKLALSAAAAYGDEYTNALLTDVMNELWPTIRDSDLFAQLESVHPGKWDTMKADHYFEKLLYSKHRDAPVDEFTEVLVAPYSFHETLAGFATVELTDLEANTEYFVHITDMDGAPLTEPFSFKTAPDSTEDIMFVSGSDSYRNREVRRLINAKVAAQEPDFVTFTGDLINEPLLESDWDEWFDDWHELMITEDGRRIPIVPALGNHEVIGMFDREKHDAPHYFGRFHLPGLEKYYALDYGPDLTIISLDSQHTTPVAGEQTRWLADTLASYEESDRWLLAQYHFPAWPNYRSMDEPVAVSIREHWLPLFEAGRVRVAMESHEHTFKVTKPIKNNAVVGKNEGVIYIGDGGWGSPLRDPRDPFETWWLSETSSNHHFFKISLIEGGEKLHVVGMVLEGDDWIEKELFELDR